MFKRIYLIYTVLLLSVVTLTACQSTPEIGIEASMASGSYRVVTVSELQTMLEEKDFVMINVHTPWQGNIPQTDLRLPYDQIEKNQDQLPTEKDTKILVYCYTSGMAKKAISTLLIHGYTNLRMLDGGTTAWEEAGLSLIKE